MKPISCEEVSRWQRGPGGGTLQFFATHEEIQGWLVDSLLPEYGPYRLIFSTFDEQKKLRNYHIALVGDFCSVVATTKPYNYYLWPVGELGEPVFDGTGDLVERVCGFNGCVLVQYCSYEANCGRESRFAVIGSAECEDGRIQKNEVGLKLFRRLKRMAQKQLRFSSFVMFPNGVELENTTMWRMTAGAVERYEKGFRYQSHRPGNFLRK